MKYGILFSITSALLTVAAMMHGGWYLFFLWPAVSFAVVASGYFCFGPYVYGKSHDGVLSMSRVVVLFPYLLYSWSVWHFLRMVKRENAYDQLTENIYIGRRLLGNELSDPFDHVIDLTSEFTEPKQLRGDGYHSFQILDGDIPTLSDLQTWTETVSHLNGDVYIHCAEGYGRTGLFAATLLFKLGRFPSTTEALKFVQSKRPLVRLGSRQRELLASYEIAKKA